MQYSETLKGGGQKQGQEPVKVPYNMKHLEQRIHRTNEALKSQGMKSPLTNEALREAAPRAVSQTLDAYEKAGLFSGNPNKADLMKANEQQHKQISKERQGPDLER